MTENGNQQHTKRVTSDRTTNSERQANNIKVVWGMSREHMGQRHQAQQQTLQPMPSGVEGPGQVVEGLSMTPRSFYSPLARVLSMAPRGPPDINTD